MKEKGVELPLLLRGIFPVPIPRGCLEKGGRGEKEVCGLGNYFSLWAFCLDVSPPPPGPPNTS